MSAPERPAFTEDDVANDFVDRIDTEIVGQISYGLGDYDWPETEGVDDQVEWPFTVIRDGREFEVDIDVRVTELTPERKAKRAEREAQLLTELAHYQAAPRGQQ